MAEDEKLSPLRIAFVATYVPRQCGIATFTHDLASATRKSQFGQAHQQNEVQILAVSDAPGVYAYNPTVRFELRQQNKMDYRDAADFLNVTPIDVISLQHEFGIFGGQDGAFILTLLGNLKKPIVTTLHTVLQNPNDTQRETLLAVCSLSTLVVVMAKRARQMLLDVYGVPEAKIRFIHHGVPDVPFVDSGFYKDQFGVEGRRVLLTFGLLNPNKGIEVGIDAVAQIAPEFPDVVYFILGATHPEVKKRYGQAYLVALEQRAREKGVANNIIFHNRYVTQEELCQFLLLSDIYVAPYRSKEQIVSGTLAYAMGCGKAVVSTSSWYAQEMLAGRRGLLVPFGDSHALAEKLRILLSDEVRRNQLRKKAYLFGRKMIWKEVARDYMATFREAISEYVDLFPRIIPHGESPFRKTLPEVRLDHLQLMTDDSGVLQHCSFATPNRQCGYSTHSNASALFVVIQNWRLFKSDDIMPLCQTYLSFLQDALDEKTGWLRGHMTYDRRWVNESVSHECQGQVLGALGAALAHPPNASVLGLAARLFTIAMKPMSKLESPHSWAFALMGLNAYLQRFGGATAARRHRRRLANRLLEKFTENRSDDWEWSEDAVSAVSAKLPQALIQSGRYLKDDAMIQQGLRTLEWLFSLQTDKRQGHLSLIGSKGRCVRGGKKARFEQHPIEASALIEAAREAYLVSSDHKWVDRIHMCLNWFLGINDLQEPLYDFTTSGCREGFHSSGANENQGAESTIAWLVALHAIHQTESAGKHWPQDKDGVPKPSDTRGKRSPEQ
jgi:glycosyltransferase involved in cell wall biosynthesis